MPQPSVLIVGAGPAGLILAITLLQNGVPVRVINKEPAHRIGSRGAGIQPRTLELYDILALLPEFEDALDRNIPAKRMYALPGGTKVVKEFPVADWVEPTPGTPHANPVSINQDIHEEILRSCLHKLSGTVELGTELRSFEQFPDHVVAQIVKTGADGKETTESAKFDWLVGTDGAHSVVRKQLGLTFLGETKTEERVALGDIVVEEGLDRGYWHYWIPPNQMMVLRPGSADNKTYRFAYTGLPEHLKDRAMTRDEFVEEFYTATGRRDVKFGEATWLSNFKPNMRMVDKFGEGRVFVAGDAAHCHSPTGGQGLNSSVQDSANLGWKLALVQKGLAPPALLASYSEERLPVIAEMLKLTTALHNATAARLAAPGAADDGSAWKRGGDLNMLGVNSRGSSIVLGAAADGGASAYTEAAAPDGRVQAGFRAPDAPGLVALRSSDAPTRLFNVFGAAAHTALVFGDDGSGGVAEALRRVPAGVVRAVLLLPAGQAPAGVLAGFDSVLEDTAGHAYGGYGARNGDQMVVIVRPDGVVGAVVDGPEGVEQYFKLILA
ncbi:FAD binding domain-containing protein [Mycena sp. CBHHK59/15]|nr:FAD binding domain-containing protein [Mycena sp. CBHHK59/15]